jgi:LysM repeat protein
MAMPTFLAWTSGVGRGVAAPNPAVRTPAATPSLVQPQFPSPLGTDRYLAAASDPMGLFDGARAARALRPPVHGGLNLTPQGAQPNAAADLLVQQQLATLELQLQALQGDVARLTQTYALQGVASPAVQPALAPPPPPPAPVPPPPAPAPPPPPPPPPAPAPPPPPAAAPAPAQADKTYTVNSGDSLSAIAQNLLGDGNRWPELYDLNKDVVGADPNLIFPGQVLKLPGNANAPAAIASPAPAPAPAPQPAPGGKMSWPVKGPITSPFGTRNDPFSGKPGQFHSGLDIGVGMGTPIHVPLGGKVTFAGTDGGYGNHIVVDHGNGLQTTYSHLSVIDVSVGAQVNSGQEIGKVGSTGYSTGPHLHFEVKRNGQFVDPKTVLG